jgi:putative ABC transport system permease protein
MSAVELRGYPSLAERALTAGAWHANHGRLLLSIIGVALGVSLGVAVHLINSSAINQFTVAARALAGDADLTIRGPLSGFSEEVYPAIARLPEVEVASPALEFDLRCRPGSRCTWLPDPFQALRIQPALFGTRFDSVLELLEPDAVILSFAAAEELNVPKGGRLIAQAGTQPLPLRVIAILPAEANAQRIAFTDIATAQWKMQRLGVLNRIDIKVAANADVAQVADRIAKLLPAGVQVGDIDVQSRETKHATRAYRVNLNMRGAGRAVHRIVPGVRDAGADDPAAADRDCDPARDRLTRGGVMRILLTESMVIPARWARSSVWCSVMRWPGSR